MVCCHGDVHWPLPLPLLLGESGIRRMELVDWYLQANEADMETVDEVREKRMLVEKVIDRLVQHVSFNHCAWFK